MLVPNPKERGDDVNLRTRLGGHVTRTQVEVEILDEEQNVRGELDPSRSRVVEASSPVTGTRKVATLAR